MFVVCYNINLQLTVLRDEFNQCKSLLSNVSAESKRTEEALNCKVIGLKEELTALSSQLAQRVALYQAQERRYFESINMSQSQSSTLYDEVKVLTGRVQQYEIELKRTDDENRDQMLQLHELQRMNESLRLELETTNQGTVELSQQLSEQSALIDSLQSTITRLKGTSSQDFEIEMTTELQHIKKREMYLSQQIEELRKREFEEQEQKVGLQQMLESLKQQIVEKDRLLMMAQNLLSDKTDSQYQANHHFELESVIINTLKMIAVTKLQSTKTMFNLESLIQSIVELVPPSNGSSSNQGSSNQHDGYITEDFLSQIHEQISAIFQDLQEGNRSNPKIEGAVTGPLTETYLIGMQGAEEEAEEAVQEAEVTQLDDLHGALGETTDRFLHLLRLQIRDLQQKLSDSLSRGK